MAGDDATRRIGGLAAAILLAALLLVGIEFALSPPAGSYEVTVDLGRAGSGMSPGIDVKARGVLVGEVAEVWLEDGRAIATLTIFPDHPLPDEDRLTPVVTSKTFLGQKQIELILDGEISEPHLADGALLTVPDDQQPREPVDLFEEFAAFIAAIPASELGEVIEALGTFTTADAEIAGRNIELSEELFAFQARTADDQIERLTDLADIVDEISPRAADLNRLMRTVPEWTTLLPDRQAEIRRNLDALSSFSITFAELLEHVEPDLHELLVTGDRLGRILDPRMAEIGNIIHGAYRYGYNFGHHGGELDDGTEHAWFRIIFPVFEDLCYAVGDATDEQIEDALLAEILPNCPAPEDGPGQERDG